MASSSFDILTRHPISVTAGSKITINSQGCYKVGKLVCINVRFTTTAAVSTNEVLFSGLPLPCINVYADMGNGYNSSAYGGRMGNDKFYANGAIPSGTECNVAFTYVKL